MLAFALCLLLFGFWMLLGCAMLWPLESRMPRVRKLLLAPAVGMVVHGVPLFILNLAGVPVGKCGIPVLIILLIAALIVMARFARSNRDEDRTPLLRQFAPFGGILLLALIMTGRPMFLFNFDWVSFCNDDMANYDLGALRVLDVGYFKPPDPAKLKRGIDYVHQMWFLHVPGMHRPGSEMVLASLCALTGKSSVELFMVLILAMHTAQVSALAGLLYRKPEDLKIALVAIALLAFSALASLGALYQLIAQVSGLAIATAAAALLLRPMADPDDLNRPTWRAYLKQGILVGVLIGGLMIFYPEVFPFLALTWLIYVVVGVLRGRLPIKPLLATLGFGALSTLAVLNWYTPVSLTYLMMQAGTGTRVEDPQRTLFPYYLMPTGLSNLWGLQPLATLGTEPWQSLAILVGLILFIAVAIAALVYTWRGDANATLALVMAGMGLFLFYKRAGFGLYKLAMYAQPAFMGMIATAWLGFLAWRGRKAVRNSTGGALLAKQAGLGAIAAIPLVAIAVISGITQYSYVRSSCGVGQTFNEILDASDSRVFNEFKELVEARDKKVAQEANPRKQQYLVDSYNLVLAKFQSMGNRTHEMAFPSNRFYYPGGYANYPALNGKQLIRLADEMMLVYNSQFQWQFFRVHEHDTTGIGTAVSGADNASGDSAGDGDATNTFLFNNLAAEMADTIANGGDNPKADVTVVATTGKQSPFNRRHIKPNNPKTNFVFLSPREAQNHLVFVSSELGHPYFSGGRIKPNYAIYQLESEPLFFKGKSMAGVGQHVLFQVINPSRDKSGKGRVRMVLDMTASYKADFDNSLPHSAELIGSEHVNFPGLVGRGATRAVSEPVEPQIINGQSYIQIDMGIEGTKFPEPRKGLMKLWGTDVAIDRRKLVGFLRDISLVSDEEYRDFKPPTELRIFTTGKNDLRDNTQFEYSGIYEDGWISEHSFFTLSQPAGPDVVAVVQCEIPRLASADANFQTHAQLVIDGKVVAEKTIGIGTLDLSVPMPAIETSANSLHRVELRFNNFRKLPPNKGYEDGRPVAGKLKYIGFKKQTPVVAQYNG